MVDTFHRDNRPRFSLRELALVTAGTSVLLFGLNWVARDIDPDKKLAFFLFYSIPVVTGMAGLLFGRYRWGVIGAVGGAAFLAILIFLLR